MTATATNTPTSPPPPAECNPQSGQIRFYDDFNSAMLEPHWSFVRESPNHWSLTERQGYMRIRTQEGAMFRETKTARNLLLRALSDGQLPALDMDVIWTNLEFHPLADFHQGGLLVYQDDDNFLRLVRGFASGQRIFFVKEIAGDVARESVPEAGEILELRIVKQGDTYTGYYRTGTELVQVGQFDNVNLSNVRVGLGAWNGEGTGAPEIPADFQDFCLLARQVTLPTIDVVKTANPDNVPEPGGDVVFGVQATNTSDRPLTLESLVDDVYGDLNGQGSCSVPQTIAAGASYQCSFSAHVTGNAFDSHTDTVTARAIDDQGNAAEDSDSATVTITDVLPVIGVDKTANPSSLPEPGGTVNFTVRVTNGSVEPVTLNSLVDDIHGDLNGQGSCSVPQTIAIGATYECSFTAEVTGSAGDSETDTVTAAATDDEGNLAEASARATVDISAFRVTVNKDADPIFVPEPGGSVTFSVRVTNDDFKTITLTSLVDDVYGDLNGRGTCSVPQTLLAFDVYECSFTAEVAGNGGDTETDTVTATVVDDQGHTGEVSDDATVTITDVLPEIQVTKTADPDSVTVPGGTVNFTVRVTNRSTVESVTLDSLVDDVYGDLNGQGTCAVPQTIAIGATYACSFTAEVTGKAGDTQTDTVTARASDDEGNTAEDSDSATVSITAPLPQIAVEKTANPSSVPEPGGAVMFVVRVTNVGVQTVTLNSLVDDVHGDLGGRGTCLVPQTIAAGATYECSFTAEVTGNAFDTETDTVTARATDDQGRPAEDSDSATVTITDVPPRIGVQKTVNPSSVPEPGGVVTFTVRVTNNSVEPVTLTSLVDDIHGDLNGRGSCAVPQTIPVGGAYECSFTAQILGNPRTETDTVTAQATDDEGNTAEATDRATVSIIDVKPVIVVSKTASPNSLPEPGGEVTFTVRVTNDSVEPVTLTSLVDDIHGDLNGRGSCAVSQTIPVDGTYECSFTAQILGNPRTETDTVTAQATDDEGNTAQASDSATVVITDVPIQASISKEASPGSVPEPGGTVTFTVRITNNGRVEAITLTSLVDDVHGDLNGRGSCAVPQTIGPGATYECSFTAEVTGNAGDSQTDTVTARLTDDEGNTVDIRDSFTVTITDVPVNVTVSKTADPGSLPEPGGSVEFTVRVANPNLETVTLVSLVDDVYGDLNGRGSCAVPQTIGPGATYDCSFTAEVMGNAGDSQTDTVTAQVTDDEGNIGEGSDTATVTITDVPPRVEVRKTADPSSIREPGGTVTFTLQVTNTGSEPVTLISLVDDVYGDLSGRGTCAVPQTIAVGATYQCSFTAEVTGEAGDRHTDTVTARVTDDEGNTAEAYDSATVSITGKPPVCTDTSLTVKKYHDLNGNGQRDENEPYLSGWIFRITFNGHVFDIVTDENGTATLGGLSEGQTVTIEERLDLLPEENWLSTTGNPIQVTLACGENVLWFGNARGQLPPTGRGTGLSGWALGVMLAGLAVYLALLATVGRTAVLQVAGHGVRMRPQSGQWVGWLVLPLVLVAVIARRLRRRGA